MSKPIPLQPGCFYHIYNRGNNRENLFIEERNYHHFLKLYTRYIEPVAQTYAYCLLKNHFHVLVRIKGVDEHNPSKPAPNPSSQFSHLFNAYAKAINKAYSRTGSLFEHPFRRVEVNSMQYRLHVVTYIHRNPQSHGMINDFRAWPYSSYQAFCDAQPTHLQRNDVLDWFGSAQQLVNAHKFQAADSQLIALLEE
jgi:putative transposase